MSDLRCVFEAHAVIGECPIWDSQTSKLYWVDCLAPSVHRLDPATGAHESWKAPETIGSFGLRKQGGLVAALQSGFFFFDPESDRWSVAAKPESEPAGNRFNDGRVDPAGRFWAGTTSGPSRADTGSLYRLDADGQCRRVFNGIIMSNALCWSPDGRTMYHADTFRRTISAYDFDRGSGETSNRRVFLELTPAMGMPDGAVCDTEGYVWLACFLGGVVLRIDPRGKVAETVNMPVSRPTCTGFGGPDLKTLYITSARFGLDEDGLAKEPLAGAVFAMEVDVPGVPEARADYR